MAHEMTKPSNDERDVIDEAPGHRVKNRHHFKSGGAWFWVWECTCGASSALHPSRDGANESYLAHRDGSKLAELLPEGAAR